MSRVVIRQAIGAILFVTIFCIVLLVSTSLALNSIAGAHHAYTGVMLIAPSYQHQHNRAYEV